MITLTKLPGIPNFGAVAGDARIKPGNRGCAEIQLSPIGRIIRNCIHEFSLLDSRVRVLQYAVMPDHIHILVFVTKQMEKPLGALIARWKVTVNRTRGGEAVFNEGYNDQILKPGRSLDTLFRYIKENPHRLAARQQFPEYFRRCYNVLIEGKRYNTYGNFFLLKNPFKEQVIVHRRDSESEHETNRHRWMYCASNGGVLISPFISTKEKEIRRQAESLGGSIILIIPEAFGSRFKPAAHDFQQCEQGKLLIIATAQSADRQPLSLDQCLAMNELALTIATAG